MEVDQLLKTFSRSIFIDVSKSSSDMYFFLTF